MRIKKQYRDAIKIQTLQYKALQKQVVERAPRDQHKELIKQLREDRMRKMADLALQYDQSIAEMLQRQTVSSALLWSPPLDNSKLSPPTPPYPSSPEHRGDAAETNGGEVASGKLVTLPLPLNSSKLPGPPARQRTEFPPLLLGVSAETGRGTGARTGSATGAAAVGTGAAQRLPEQAGHAAQGAARPRGEGPAGEGVRAQGPPRGQGQSTPPCFCPERRKHEQTPGENEQTLRTNEKARTKREWWANTL